MSDDERAYAVKDLAEKWGCSEMSICDLVEAGKIHAFRIGIGNRRTNLRIPARVVAMGLPPGTVLLPPDPPQIKTPREPISALAMEMIEILRAGTRDGTFVYFIRCEQFVKIGRSRRPSGRLAEVAALVPFEPKFLKLVATNVTAERALQRHLSAYHHRFEWFRLEPELAAAIRQLPGNREFGRE